MELSDIRLSLMVMDLKRLSCIRPTRITIYCGLVEEGRKLFEAMKLDYGFVIDREHFSCMAQIPVGLIVEYSN